MFRNSDLFEAEKIVRNWKELHPSPTNESNTAENSEDDEDVDSSDEDEQTEAAPTKEEWRLTSHDQTSEDSRSPLLHSSRRMNGGRLCICFQLLREPGTMVLDNEN
jgi:hypothetical protein